MFTSPGQLPIIDGLSVSGLRFTLAFAVQVNVSVREDAVQPGLQVRALLELWNEANAFV